MFVFWHWLTWLQFIDIFYQVATSSRKLEVWQKERRKKMIWTYWKCQVSLIKCWDIVDMLFFLFTDYSYMQILIKLSTNLVSSPNWNSFQYRALTWQLGMQRKQLHEFKHCSLWTWIRAFSWVGMNCTGNSIYADVDWSHVPLLFFDI